MIVRGFTGDKSMYSLWSRNLLLIAEKAGLDIRFLELGLGTKPTDPDLWKVYIESRVKHVPVSSMTLNICPLGLVKPSTSTGGNVFYLPSIINMTDVLRAQIKEDNVFDRTLPDEETKLNLFVDPGFVPEDPRPSGDIPRIWTEGNSTWDSGLDIVLDAFWEAFEEDEAELIVKLTGIDEQISAYTDAHRVNSMLAQKIIGKGIKKRTKANVTFLWKDTILPIDCHIAVFANKIQYNVGRVLEAMTSCRATIVPWCGYYKEVADEYSAIMALPEPEGPIPRQPLRRHGLPIGSMAYSVRASNLASLMKTAVYRVDDATLDSKRSLARKRLIEITEENMEALKACLHQ